ncbi:MAG TPA: glycosyltransferase family 2 protein [Spirochaetota bacterium]|nr:glycosyltransferase family 2 protein [Spirochaetota bacterium]
MTAFKITFIIPHRATEAISATVKCIKDACRENNLQYQIITATGNNPTYQRNRCITKARYSYIYFIDNDSKISADALKRAAALIQEQPDIAVLGGPALTPDSDTCLQQNFKAVFSSPWAVGSIASRYAARGRFRSTDDSELILCNLLVKKELFNKVGYFNEKLYPNEENEFISRVKQAGFRVCYDPGFYIKRSQRASFFKFIKQLFTYGRGRGEQTRLMPASFNIMLLLPLFFVLYLLTLPFFLWIVKYTPYSYSGQFFLLIPFGLYIFFDLAAFFSYILTRRQFPVFFPLFFCLNHIIYIAGFLRGLLRKTLQSELTKPVCNIKIIKNR